MFPNQNNASERTPERGAEPAAAPLQPPQGSILPEDEGASVRLLDRASLLLAGLFVAGIICMYVLSLKSGPAKASAEQLRVETQVNSALSELRNTSIGVGAPGGKRDVTAVFYYEARQRQIPIASLPGNAFVFKRPSHASVAFVSVKEPKPADQPRLDEIQALAEAKKLELQSVLAGTHGATAMISNNLLTKGQSIRGWTVEKIFPRRVVLIRNGRRYTLEMAK